MLKTTLEQWRMFKAVVDHGGFNQASEVVHKSQSTVHHAVYKLEEAVGVKLIEIKSRRVHLTESGKVMLRKASYILDEAHKMEAVATSLSTGIETQLSIAVDEAFPQNELYKVLDTVSTQYPLLRVELVETILSGANELLKAGKVDIALSPYTIPDCINEEICQIEFIPVAAPTYSLNNLGRAVTMEDLKSHRQIVVRDSAVDRRKDEGWLGSEQRWTVSHLRTSAELITQGLGFAWHPRHALENQIDSGDLMEITLAQPMKRRAQLYLNFLDADKLGPAAKAFLGELRYQTQHLPVSDDW